MDDGKADRLAKATTVGSAGLADLLAQASNSPELSGALGAAAAAIGLGMTGISRRRAEKAATAAQIGADEAELQVDALIDILLQSDVKSELLAEVLQGAARSIDLKKLHVFGHALAIGAGTDDGAKLHHQVFMAKIIADLEMPHLYMLRYMEKDPEVEGHLRLARFTQLQDLFEPPAMSSSVIATLVRHALLQGYSREAFERSFDQQSKLRAGISDHTSDPVVYMITSLGEYTLSMYRDAGSS